MKKLIATHIKTNTNPTSTDNQAAGYGLGQTWINQATGEKFYYKEDIGLNAIWILESVDRLSAYNVFFINSSTGSNTTGSLGDKSKPFQTVAGALATLPAEYSETYTFMFLNSADHVMPILPKKNLIFENGIVDATGNYNLCRLDFTTIIGTNAGDIIQQGTEQAHNIVFRKLTIKGTDVSATARFRGTYSYVELDRVNIQFTSNHVEGLFQDVNVFGSVYTLFMYNINAPFGKSATDSTDLHVFIQNILMGTANAYLTRKPNKRQEFTINNVTGSGNLTLAYGSTSAGKFNIHSFSNIGTVSLAKDVVSSSIIYNFCDSVFGATTIVSLGEQQGIITGITNKNNIQQILGGNEEANSVCIIKDFNGKIGGLEKFVSTAELHFVNSNIKCDTNLIHTNTGNPINANVIKFIGSNTFLQDTPGELITGGVAITVEKRGTNAIDSNMTSIGTNVTVNATINNAGGGGGGQTENFVWKFNIDTSATDPGSGKLKLNNTAYNTTTALYVSEETNSGLNLATILASLDGDWDWYIQDADDPTKFAYFTSNTSTYTDNGIWWTIPVTHTSGTGALPANNQSCTVLLINKNGAGGSVPTYTEYARSTGIITGGVLSIGTGGSGVATTFSITAGTGLVLDPLTGIGTNVSWATQIDIPVTNLLTHPLTYISINSAGVVYQTTVPLTATEERDYIVIGLIVHANLTTVVAVNQGHHLASAPLNHFYDLSSSLGIFNITGNIVSPNGANLSLNKSLGTIFAEGTNYAIDPTSPNVKTMNARTLFSFTYNNQTGASGAPVTVIDPDNYDLAGVTTVVPNNKFTIQRVYLFPSNTLSIQRGQAVYDSLAEAKAGVQTESFIVNPSITPNGLLRAFIIVKKGTTSLQSATDAYLLEANKFGGSAGVSGASVSTLQNAYDNSIVPQITTNIANGGFTIRRGSAADTDFIFKGQNGAGANTTTVDGLGNITNNKVELTENVGVKVTVSASYAVGTLVVNNSGVTYGTALGSSGNISKSMGVIVKDNYATDGTAIITDFGLVTGINTSSFSVGDLLYPNSAGVPTTTVPTDRDRYVIIGRVITSHATTGSVFVDLVKGYAGTKALGAYNMVVNNSVTADAVPTNTVYREDVEATLTTTPTFNGTAPTTATNNTFSFRTTGKRCNATFNLLYSVAGASNGQCVIPLPAEMPEPKIPSGFGGASGMMYMGVGRMFASQTTVPTAGINFAFLRRNAANDGFEILIVNGTTLAAIGAMCSIEYPTT